MKTIKYIEKIVKNPYKIASYLGAKEILNWMNDDLYLKLVYRSHIGKNLNLKNPKTYNEKLQWLKLHDRNPKYTKLVDKYEVRSYISEEIGEEYLIPLVGVYETFDEIKFNELPDKFVLKCTHDSGGVVICKDKSKFDIDNARKKINKCIKRNFYYLGREWPYKNIKPKIVCEKYMEDENIGELRDYKFMCFNGEVKCLFVCLNRNTQSGLNVDFYNLEWEKMEFERHYPRSEEIIEKPHNFKKMIKLAEKLAKDIPFVRVDFYEINKKIYFGELTFYPGCGFEEFTPEYYDELLGSWINLPNIKTI
ncbi:ATP-grasp fold amidoligase family protein [Paraclostridium bifermentans]|uniref:ATP-grasp fold amidoligase family protein n=1 Tax=Paraclostridium bifermentans TaxID=1490 RepID=UPI0003FC4241|nr:ATP-grasp fold amidoligase family protein [Paraclostridium bifermentans]